MNVWVVVAAAWLMVACPLLGIFAAYCDGVIE